MQATSDQQAFVSLENYDDIDLIRSKFPPLANINIDHNLNNLKDCRFFIIRTQGEDNVHRAMKYGIWTSSSRKNERLDEAFRNKKEDVYLFFTEINSMCFSGMAKLTSEFNAKAHFKYWLIENKWFGTFQIQWLYVKDIPFKHFDEIKQIQKLEGSEETLKSVYDLIDCTELTVDNGIKMARIFQMEKTNKSLFEEFPQLDKLEFQSRQERTNNIRFEKKFQELSAVFETIPFSFSVASYERKKTNRKAQGSYYQSQYGQQYYYQQPYQQYYQQPFVGYQFQQTPQYWQFNNGFYQNQYQYQQNQYNNNNNNEQGFNKPQQSYEKQQHLQNHYSNQQQQSNTVSQQPQQNTNQESNQNVQSVPLEQRFQINHQQLQKKGKFDKNRNKNNKDNIQYVEKNSTEAPVQKY
ncbi:unnamed protein product [Paramecium pentaurelia]|uniref:YTH domain-containing protein n=1 Tax=Paramecium pentaurelia TaxID=43138 RepID=A0A8S1XEH1_9CILI|nr:unnamed protein product [Paramecium pentaurelia]